MVFTAYSDGWLDLAGRSVRCALGRAGVIAARDKREGDGATPEGQWPIRRLLYRPDRARPPETQLAVRPLTPRDGWCETPGDPNYNLMVALPYAVSVDRLWREDHLYDLVVILGYNDAPVVPGAGSAIFMHLAREGYAPTQGCVALARSDLGALLVLAKPGDALAISAAPMPR
jgi:L,D-peptidoglycan transpeptidase YkuD (ErfK/YbiS/YcfS/YnhG family)